MDTAAYEKIVINDSDFPVVVLENDKNGSAFRQSLCPLHWHEHLELHYVFAGTLHLRINQNEYTLQAGDLAVINSNDMHSSWFSGQLNERILIFRPEDLTPKLTQMATTYDRYIPGETKIIAIMEAFEQEFTNAALGWDIACKGHLLQLMLHLARNFSLHPKDDPAELKHTQQLRRLLPVQNYIQLHYNEDISVETLADLIYLSKDRFNHLFKECMGIPLRKFINDIRLHSAYGWLEKGQCSPTEAATRSGFTDYNYFGRLFRQTFGCTPSQVIPR